MSVLTPVIEDEYSGDVSYIINGIMDFATLRLSMFERSCHVTLLRGTLPTLTAVTQQWSLPSIVGKELEAV